MFPLFSLLIYTYTLLLHSFLFISLVETKSQNIRRTYTHAFAHSLLFYLYLIYHSHLYITHEYIKRKVPRMPTFIEGGMDAKYGDNSALLWFCL